ncbi:MAG TPA: 6-phosphogluconolactonase [Acidimicrobiia bacterium]|jgi:glucosamine-6-phosphate deaminase|nr:6-phosphogluconolactonase [Acidimicrobiia bacterium]
MEDARLVPCPDGAALAGETSRFVSAALAAHPGRFVALAVGDSTLPLYAGLDAADPAWAGRAIMPVDELVPPPADPARRFSARLAAALPQGLRSLLVPIDVASDPDGRAGELDARLQVDGLAAVVLGLGPDGHFAFNQPPTPFDAAARLVDLAPANLTRLGPVAPARSALTLGVTTVMAAGSVLVIAAGAGKGDALNHLLSGPEEAAWPVTWLRRHPRLTIAGDINLR